MGKVETPSVFFNKGNLKNHWTTTRLVCTHFCAFFMMNSRINYCSLRQQMRKNTIHKNKQTNKQTITTIIILKIIKKYIYILYNECYAQLKEKNKQEQFHIRLYPTHVSFFFLIIFLFLFIHSFIFIFLTQNDTHVAQR